MFPRILDIITSETDGDYNDKAAIFFSNSLFTSLQILVDTKLQPDALHSVACLAFTHFEKTTESRVNMLISLIDSVIDLMQSKHFLHRFESSISEHLQSAIALRPVMALAKLIIKFVGLASPQFNCSRIMREVLIKAKFADDQRVTLLRQMIRHKCFEKVGSVALVNSSLALRIFLTFLPIT